MKRLLYALVASLLPLAAWTQTYVEVNETNFPDMAFRELLKSGHVLINPSVYDATTNQIDVSQQIVTLILNSDETSKTFNVTFEYEDEDGNTQSATETVTVGEAVKNIRSLEGIKLLTSLNALSINCPDKMPYLTELDLSGLTSLTNVTAQGYSNTGDYLGKLESVNLNGCTALEVVQLECNRITEIDLTGCTKVKTLQLGDNLISTIDVSHMADLDRLKLERNRLSYLDVTANEKLTHLNCSANSPGLPSIDVSKNTELVYLNVSAGDYTDKYNHMQDLDVSNNAKLVELYCNSHELTSLKVDHMTELKVLDVGYNILTSLDVTKNTKLEDLKFNYNYTRVDGSMTPTFTSIDLSQNVNLKYLSYRGCRWETPADLSANKKLQTLDIRDNNLRESGLSAANTELTSLNIYGNRFRAIDLSDKQKLTRVEVGTNKLTVLNLANNPKFATLASPLNQNLYDNISVFGDKRNKIGFDITEEMTAGRFYASNNADYPSQFNIYPRWYPGQTSSNYVGLNVEEYDGKYYVVLPEISDGDMKDIACNRTVSYGIVTVKNTDYRSVKYYVRVHPEKNYYLPVNRYFFSHVAYVNPVSEDKQDHFYSGTLFVHFDAVVPEGVEAYIVTGVKDPKKVTRNGTDVTFDQLHMKKIAVAGDVIPKETPIYFKAATAAGMYAFNMAGVDDREMGKPYTTILDADPNILDGNLLQGVPGSSDNKTVTANSVLVLGPENGIGTGQVGFWKFRGTKIPAYRCYLNASILTASNNANGATLNFDDEDGTTTGISTIKNEELRMKNAGWYTLDGRRLDGKPTQSGVYIHNGRKEVVK